jgi:hypothetical protein
MITQHTLAERGEKGCSLNALAVGPELGHGQGGSVRLSRHEVRTRRYVARFWVTPPAVLCDLGVIGERDV